MLVKTAVERRYFESPSLELSVDAFGVVLGFLKNPSILISGSICGPARLCSSLVFGFFFALPKKKKKKKKIIIIIIIIIIINK